MWTVILIIAGIVLGAIFASELIRATRVVVALIKGDKVTVDRLTMSYKDCESAAGKYYGYTPEIFANIYNRIKQQNPDALPYDALDFCAWEWDVVNNK